MSSLLLGLLVPMPTLSWAYAFTKQKTITAINIFFFILLSISFIRPSSILFCTAAGCAIYLFVHFVEHFFQVFNFFFLLVYFLLLGINFFIQFFYPLHGKCANAVVLHGPNAFAFCFGC